MTLSLMNLLGSAPNLSVGNADEPGKVVLTANGGDANFEVVMAAEDLKDVSAKELQAFFAAHGLPASMADTLKTQNLLAQSSKTDQGQKLPGHVLSAKQAGLPAGLVESIEQSLVQFAAQQRVTTESSLTQEVAIPTVDAEVSVEQSASTQASPLQDLLAQLPERELTPEELSDIVQKTGLPPYVIFEALQDTPAASPNLASAMVDSMGAAEKDALAYVARPLQKPTTLAGAMQQMEAAEQNSSQNAANQSTNAGVQGKQGEQASMPKADVIAKIVAAMNNTQPDEAVPNQAAIAEALAKQAQQAVKKEVAAPQATAQSQVQAQTPPVPQAKPNPQAVANAAPPAQDALQQQAQPKTPKPDVTESVQPHGNAAASSHGKEAAQAQAQGAQPQGQVQNQNNTNNGTQPDFANVLRVSEAPAEQPRSVAKNQMPQQPAPKMQHPHITDQVNVRIHQAAKDGAHHMEIKLHPAELGRVDVKIETHPGGQSHITITADSRDTLDALVRDARALEHSLRDAGIKADSQNLQFNLRGDDQQHAKSQQQGEGKESGSQQANGDDDLDADGMDEKLSASEMALTYDAGRSYRLNLEWGVDISA